MADGCAARVGESPLEEKEEAGKTDRARRPIAVETNGSGGRLRPLRRSTNYPHCLFAFYATALANDISRSARCYHENPLRKISARKRVGRGKGRKGRFRGRNDRLEICVATLADYCSGENILRRGMKYRVM